MLGIDDNMLRLLKMKERLLGLSDSNQGITIDDYKSLAMEVDSVAFDELKKQFSHYDYHDLPPTEEIKYLQEIEDSYIQLYELQCKFLNICKKHNREIKLSNLDTINIDGIRERISTINGYLINNKNIDENKKKLDELNEQLISEERKKENATGRFHVLEVSLKDRFLSSEGRIFGDSDSHKPIFTSIKKEYGNIDIDLLSLIRNNKELDIQLKQATKDKSDSEEKLKAAEVCYNSMPNSNNKQILKDIRLETSKIKYRYVLIKMLSLIGTEYEDYDKIKEKREKLIDLMNNRNSYLSDMGIKYLVDPFSRLKVLEQLDEIRKAVNNSKILGKLKKEISSLSSRTEEMLEKNAQFLKSLANTSCLFIDKEDSKPIMDDVLDQDRPVCDNCVVGVKKLPVKFNKNIALEKARSVIKRVYKMVYDILPPDDTKSADINPELVIVPALEVNENKEVDLKEEDSMFETINPFEKTVLFEDRTEENQMFYDDSNKKGDSNLLDLVEYNDQNNKNGLDDSMPELFWEIPKLNGTEITNNETISFDEQVNELLDNKEKDGLMIKKKVA